MKRLTKRVNGMADISDEIGEMDREDRVSQMMEKLCRYEEAEKLEHRRSQERAGERVCDKSPAFEMNM